MDNQVTMAQVIEFIKNVELTAEEWSSLTNTFVETRTQRMGSIRKEVSVGQVVEFYNKKLGITVLGKIIKKGPKNAYVQTSDGRATYQVPYTLLPNS